MCVCAEADLEEGVQDVQTPLKFEKSPFYFGFLQIYVGALFILDPPPPSSSDTLDPPHVLPVLLTLHHYTDGFADGGRHAVADVALVDVVAVPGDVVDDQQLPF